MPDWREQILKEFAPGVARLTLVADPDGLLLEEGILQGIHESGFELIPFEDHIAFRYAYESKFRSRWDRGESTDLVVVLRSEQQDLSTLPYDLLQAGRKLSFSIGELFRHLSYPVVAALDRADLDALFQAQVDYGTGDLGSNATKDFILLHVFDIAPALIKQRSDLLRVLLRRHYRGQRVPDLLNDRFIQILRQGGRFDDWPLEQIVPDRKAFFAFLQERWPLFLDRVSVSDSKELSECSRPYGLQFEGPIDIPFDHDDVRIYVDNLFLEGALHPVAHERAEALSDKWLAAGLRLDPVADQLRRLDRLLSSVDVAVPCADARHQEWLLFAYKWAEVLVLWRGTDVSPPADLIPRFEEVQSKIDAAFLSWVRHRYHGLHNQPSAPPVMVHHLPRYLARKLSEEAYKRCALIVLDGLALDQWIALRDEIMAQRPDIRFREEAVFAWVPTVTSVSRQAIFAGKPPLYFPESIRTTDKEPVLWKQFWADHGFTSAEVTYAKGLGNGDLATIGEIVSNPRARVAGLVVDKVDRIMHGMELGASGMHSQVRHWAKQGYLTDLLVELLNRGFAVFITSDHGNIEARGCGRPSEGAIADVRGARARVYPDILLRSRVGRDFPDAIEWPSIGLPDDYLPLLAPSRSAFVREGERLVGHGGIALEEVIVPLVEVTGRVS